MTSFLKIILSLLLLGAMAGCKPTTMEITRLNITDSIYTPPPVNSTRIQVLFTVDHPPKNIDTLAAKLLEYSKNHRFRVGTSNFAIEWYFYRETSFTPRDYTPGTASEDQIDFHSKDWLLVISNFRSSTQDCWSIMYPESDMDLKYACVQLPLRAEDQKEFPFRDILP